jgi:carboxyl-terminal processing protease
MSARVRGVRVAAIGLVVVLVGGCASAPSAAPSDSTPPAFSPTVSFETSIASPSASVGTTPSLTAGGERTCPYVPGATVATMPDDVIHPPTPSPEPTDSPPPPSEVSAATTKRQLGVLAALAKAVTDKYVDPAFNGKDWPAIESRYRTLVAAGLSDDDFYVAMKLLVAELGDDHSQFQSPADVAESDAELSGHNDYVGIGVSVVPFLETRSAVVLFTFPGSPAERAGLAPHDRILDIDGQPVFDAADLPTVSRMRGPAGTQVTLTVDSPAQPAHDIVITRAKVNGALPVESCLIAATRVGYIFLPSLFDETFPDQVRSALRAMSADGPLAGLVIDNRMDSGGSSAVLDPILGLFVSGTVGTFQSRTASRPFVVTGQDVGGSQTVPLVVLVGRDTVSFGEIMSGILQASGRAVVIGQTSLGNVETLTAFTFDDGSRAWIARETFVPAHAKYGPWEDTGIEPDVSAPARWDLFTEGNDPALSAALQALGVH